MCNSLTIYVMQEMPTGEVELIANNVTVLNKCKPDLPFSPNSKFQKVWRCVLYVLQICNIFSANFNISYFQINETSRMEFRYLDIRHNQMQANLRMRSEVIMSMRQYLCQQHGNEWILETIYHYRKTNERIWI